MFESGDAEAARKLIGRHQAMVEGATPDCVISLYAIAIELAAEAGEADRAVETAHRLEELGRLRAEEGIQRAALGYRALLHANRGEADAAEVALDELAALEVMATDPLRSPVDALVRDVFRIRARLALGQAAEQLPEIEHLLVEDGRALNPRRRLRLTVLKALALQQLGRSAEALRTMTDALEEGLGGGSVQAFLGLGAHGSSLVRAARKAQPVGALGDPALVSDLRELVEAVERSSKPVIVAIHGMALGGGLELALAGHYRLAQPNTRFGFPEVSLGLLPGADGTQRLPRLIGASAALGLMLSGSPISAEKAASIGLVDELVAEGLIAAAIGLAERGVPVRRTGGLPIPSDLAEAVASAREKLAPVGAGQAQASIIACVAALDVDLGV